MTTQWGAPLTGEQMKLLRAAGLPDSHWVEWDGGIRGAAFWEYEGNGYRLPANHPAYTMLNAGWLDGRNVRLWFGGDEAPDDWVEYSEVLLRSGSSGAGMGWCHYDCRDDIIAYIAKDEIIESDEPDTITIAKMTPDEIMERFNIPADEHQRSAFGRGAWTVLELLGLIKPEPTREERFWAAQDSPSETSAFIRAWVKMALEFER